MHKDRNAFLAGIFILICAGLIVATIVGIKGATRLTEPSDERTVRFALSDNVGGLNSGDEVRVGGVKVGVVKDVHYEPPRSAAAAATTMATTTMAATAGTSDDGASAGAVLVTFTLPRRIELRQGAHVLIESTVTGTTNLNIDNVGTGDVVAVNDTLTGSPSTLSALLAAAGQAAPQINGLLSDVRTTTVPKVNTALDKTASTVDTFRETGTHATELVKALRERLQPITDRVVAVLDNARGAMANLKDFLGDNAGGDFKHTLANLNTATGSFKDKLPGILDKVDAALAKAQNTVDDINSSLQDIKQVAANTKDITASGRSIVVQNRGKIDSMVASLKTTGDNLKNASAEIRRSPWRLLYKPGEGEVANLNLYDSARQFAEGASSLSDASTALRDALRDPNVDQKKVQNLVEQLDKSFANFNQVEQQLWKGVHE